MLHNSFGEEKLNTLERLNLSSIKRLKKIQKIDTIKFTMNVFFFIVNHSAQCKKYAQCKENKQ